MVKRNFSVPWQASSAHSACSWSGLFAVFPYCNLLIGLLHPLFNCCKYLSAVSPIRQPFSICITYLSKFQIKIFSFFHTISVFLLLLCWYLPNNLCVRNTGLTGGGFHTSFASWSCHGEAVAHDRNTFTASLSDLVLWTRLILWFCCYNERMNDSLLSLSGGVSGSLSAVSYYHLGLGLLRDANHL